MFRARLYLATYRNLQPYINDTQCVARVLPPLRVCRVMRCVRLEIYQIARRDTRQRQTAHPSRDVKMACVACLAHQPTPVTKTSLRDTPICLILCVPFLAIGWELCVPARTGALLAPWRVHRYRSLRTAPSRSREKVRASLAGAQHPAMISRTLILHHSHY